MHLLWNCVPEATPPWFLLLRQTSDSLFAPGQWTAEDEGYSLYSVVDKVEEFRGCGEGQGAALHFRMLWKGLNFYNEWWQDSNPVNETEVRGFRGEESFHHVTYSSAGPRHLSKCSF